MAVSAEESDAALRSSCRQRPLCAELPPWYLRRGRVPSGRVGRAREHRTGGEGGGG